MNSNIDICRAETPTPSDSADSMVQLLEPRITYPIENTLEARVSMISAAEEIDAWLSKADICERLSIDIRWFDRIISDLGVQAQYTNIVGTSIIINIYPPYTLPILKEEIEWRQAYLLLPSYISLDDIADFSGRSWGWTKNIISQYQIGQKTYKRTGKTLYAKTILKEIRNINLSTPLAQGWITLNGLCEEFPGTDREWIFRRLEENNFYPEDRRSELTGRIFPHYSPGCKAIIRTALLERPAAAGEWLTLYRLLSITGRSENWLRKRLPQYDHLSEPRIDDQGVTRKHYPPIVAHLLKKESDRQNSCPPVGDYLSAKYIGRRLGHATLWAVNQLSLIGVEPEPRKDKLGRISDYYPPECLAILAGQNQPIPSN